MIQDRTFLPGVRATERVVPIKATKPDAKVILVPTPKPKPKAD